MCLNRMLALQLKGSVLSAHIPSGTLRHGDEPSGQPNPYTITKGAPGRILYQVPFDLRTFLASNTFFSTTNIQWGVQTPKKIGYPPNL